VLGCTHYPLLRGLLEQAVTPGVRVIDSAEATAEAAMHLFGWSTGNGCPILESAASSQGCETGESAIPSAHSVRCFATDSVEKFERLGSRFLGRPTGPVELVDLGG
jgi:glutamate racemase